MRQNAKRAMRSKAASRTGPFRRDPEGSGRISFAVPLAMTPGEATLQQAADTVGDETDFGVAIEAREGAAFVDTKAQNAPHAVLDVVESALQNTVGDGASQPRASRKSLIHASGDTDREAQPCFVLSRRFTGVQTDEIERLLEFVGGVDATGYHNDRRFYLSPGRQALGHIALDVSEIVVRRVADRAGISISDHSIKLLPGQQ